MAGHQRIPGPGRTFPYLTPPHLRYNLKALPPVTLPIEMPEIPSLKYPRPPSRDGLLLLPRLRVTKVLTLQ